MLSTARRTALVLVALTAGGAALRFVTIDGKGFWGDEISTVSLVHHPYGGMLAQVARLESTPPLYYSLAWLWAKAFGTTEVGLRSLSALLGVMTIPVAYGAARELVARRAALFAATLIAVNPVLTWYSGEARSYAMLVFLGAASLWAFGRALRTGSRAALGLWALTCALAVLTHYFAVFVVAPEAVLLLRSRAQRGRAVAAVAAVAAACAAVLPLAVHQASFNHAAWISNSSFAGRLAALPGDLTLGFDARPRVLVAAVGAIAVAIAAGFVIRHPRGSDRSGARLAGGIVLAALGLPLGLALLGVDYLSARNSLATTVPLAVALGTGYAVFGRIGRISLAGLVALSLTVAVTDAGQPKFHSEDWRSAAEDLGRSTHARAVVATPGQAGRKPLEYYLGAAPLRGRRRVMVPEVDLVALPRQGDSRIARADLSRLLRMRVPGFRRVRAHLENDFALLAYTSSRPKLVSESMLDPHVRGGAATLVVGPRPRPRATARARSPSSS